MPAKTPPPSAAKREKPSSARLSPAQQRGRAGEDRALHHLEGHGLRLVNRNVRYPFGEIDLVMLDGDYLVFVEVRQRRDTGYGSPAESVTPAKQRRLLRAASRYLLDHPHRAGCRFDVFAITLGPPEVRIDWIRDAFGAS